MIRHTEIDKKSLKRKLITRAIRFGGNKKLRIYGTLECASGKRLNKENRVFFKTEAEAINEGYRPCGHCLHSKYKIWKKSVEQK